MRYVATKTTTTAADRKADAEWVRNHSTKTASNVVVHADSHAQFGASR